MNKLYKGRTEIIKALPELYASNDITDNILNILVLLDENLDGDSTLHISDNVLSNRPEFNVVTLNVSGLVINNLPSA